MTEPMQSKSKSMMAIRSSKSLHGLGRSISRVRMRRPSYGFSGVPGIRPVERTSQIAIEFKRPPLIYLNTYQLDPHELWNVPVVTRMTASVLDEYFTGHKYHVVDSPALAIRIAGELMRRVKLMNFNRYRIISVVTIVQRRAQCYNNAISFLWDHERDNYIDMQREETTSILQATIFGVYLD